MVEVRRGVIADAIELVRLRSIMLGAMGGTEPPVGAWQDVVADTFRAGLADPDGRMAAFVVAQPQEPSRLAACAVGFIETRLGTPANPNGQFGYVLNVSTDPAHRRRGYSRACIQALLSWYASRGVNAIELKSTDDGAPLYATLGFTMMPGTMRLYR
jgi:GNAT superfamily N-acetyltransferase